MKTNLSSTRDFIYRALFSLLNRAWILFHRERPFFEDDYDNAPHRHFAPGVGDIKVYNNVVFDPEYRALYHRNGRRIDETALWRGPLPGRVICSPKYITIRDGLAEEVTPYVYCGTYTSHFGHLLTESLARLWPFFTSWGDSFRLPPRVVLKMPCSGNTELSGASGKILKVLKSKLRVFVPRHQVLFKEIYVPTAESQLGLYASQNYISCSNAIGEAILLDQRLHNKERFKGAKVYLSRAKLKGRKRKILGESKLERHLSCNGFIVIYPETMSIFEQVMLFKNADAFVGAIGSALHGSVLAPVNNKKIIYFVNKKAKGGFKVIDRATGADVRYADVLRKVKIPYFSEKVFGLDVGRAVACLEKEGLL